MFYVQSLHMGERKLVELQITQTRHGWIKCLSLTELKLKKYLLNVHKIEGVHVQFMNKHYAKFEY